MDNGLHHQCVEAHKVQYGADSDEGASLGVCSRWTSLLWFTSSVVAIRNAVALVS